jgi:hypothetical protein
MRYRVERTYCLHLQRSNHNQQGYNMNIHSPQDLICYLHFRIFPCLCVNLCQHHCVSGSDTREKAAPFLPDEWCCGRLSCVVLLLPADSVPTPCEDHSQQDARERLEPSQDAAVFQRTQFSQTGSSVPPVHQNA